MSSYLNLKVIQTSDLNNPIEVNNWLSTLSSSNIIYSMSVQSDTFYFIYH